MRKKIEGLLSVLGHGAYERDEAISLSLLSALSGESIFLLGLPGVGKSMMARRLKKAFHNAKVFEYLMSRFSTPDEIFGPVSISKLKDEDCYERVVSGYLPEAEVVFLDEIWKAGPAIQNSLLTVLNEKIFLNGNNEILLPTKAIIAASNELPAQGEGLEALWDRFLIRYIVEPIKKKENFFRLIDPRESDNDTADECTDAEYDTGFTTEEYESLRSRASSVILPPYIKEALFEIRSKMNEEAENKSNTSADDPLPDDGDYEDDDKNKYYISDRRWKKAVGVLKTSALLNGRQAVDYSDVLLLSHMLWNEEAEIEKVMSIVSQVTVSSKFGELLSRFTEARSEQRKHLKNVQKSDGRLYCPDGKHYTAICDGIELKIKTADYIRMKSNPKEYFFATETTGGCLVFKEIGPYTVKVSKPGHININGYNYPMLTNNGTELDRTVFDKLTADADTISKELKNQLLENLFICNSTLFKNLEYDINQFRVKFGIDPQA